MLMLLSCLLHNSANCSNLFELQNFSLRAGQGNFEIDPNRNNCSSRLVWSHSSALISRPLFRSWSVVLDCFMRVFNDVVSPLGTILCRTKLEDYHQWRTG
jgi:hypothetical protein